MRRSPMARAGSMVAALAAAVGAVGCGGGGGGGTEAPAQRAARIRAGQARQIAADAGLSAEVQQFFARAAGAGGQRYTVRFVLEGRAGGVTVFQDPPYRRVDLTGATADGASPERRLVVNREGSFECSRAAGRDTPWGCARSLATGAGIGPFAEDDVDRAIRSLAASKADYTFAVEQRTVAGARADCLITALKEGRSPRPDQGRQGQLCISAEGAPLQLDGESGRLTAARYSTKVPADAFRLPARVRSG